MKIGKKHFVTIWWDEEDKSVAVIDQRLLPHKFAVVRLRNSADVCYAIKEMIVRGAPLIGVTAAYGFYLASMEADRENYLDYLCMASQKMLATRPTAVNLKWALDEMMQLATAAPSLEEMQRSCFLRAEEIKAADIDMCKRIGEAGVKLIEEIAQKKKGRPVNILTHCNAGWLACVDWGTATSPIYHAHHNGIKVHVYVDETRPRNQGAALTAYELGEEGIPHTLVADNTGGHLMQQGLVDLVIVGADRVTANGDAANKIGTYLKALAAKDNQVPFYVAFPTSTFDAGMASGREIEIEKRDQNEVLFVQGKLKNEVVSVQIAPDATPAVNFGFDVTPARLITGYITENGVYTEASGLR